MPISQLKFLAPPYVDVVAGEKAFRVLAVGILDPDKSSPAPRVGPRHKTYFIGLAPVGSAGVEHTVRLSKDEWPNPDEAYNAWWCGFEITQGNVETDSIAATLIEDGSAVAV